ncbi:sugar ABC transporter permease [Pokkaliibacter plantistimulans]|uniref:Sugar ABC transporter permease n=1 Tax=Pokkaliibacter plantistimulans TaxID=1635171 RepID=A0ABX5M072_9GAMM|nr:ABC transporter permease [Pokkaliibacter plantistimulans]PXF31799.1 sugar ABC transporter permease [Pokkaliibacter plantistimulans]
MDFYVIAVLTLDATVRVSAPLILAALAGLFSERSGVVDISLEGKMLAGAFTAACVAYLANSAWMGLAAAIVVSWSLAMLHGFACITHRGNQVVSGVAINILVAGLSIVLGLVWFHQGGQTPNLPNTARFTEIVLPGAEAVKNVPVLGELYYELIGGHNILVYIAFAAVPVVWWIVYRSRFGLRLRAVGENPKAVDTAGISVAWLRYRALMLNGVLCGMAGAYISTAQNAQFVRDMTAGQGYMALAALIFGKWRPVPVMFACLLFGFLDAVAVRLQGVEVPGIGVVPVQLIESLPYILTVVLLAGFIGKAIAPKAIGEPYTKER